MPNLLVKQLLAIIVPINIAFFNLSNLNSTSVYGVCCVFFSSIGNPDACLVSKQQNMFAIKLQRCFKNVFICKLYVNYTIGEFGPLLNCSSDLIMF